MWISEVQDFGNFELSPMILLYFKVQKAGHIPHDPCQKPNEPTEILESLNFCPINVICLYCMGENFQDESWIQDFEADFPQKVSLKMQN